MTKEQKEIEKLMERTENQKKDFSQRATLANIKNAIKLGGKR